MGIEAIRSFAPNMPQRKNSTRSNSSHDGDFQRNTIELASVVLECLV